MLICLVGLFPSYKFADEIVFIFSFLLNVRPSVLQPLILEMPGDNFCLRFFSVRKICFRPLQMALGRYSSICNCEEINLPLGNKKKYFSFLCVPAVFARI